MGRPRGSPNKKGRPAFLQVECDYCGGVFSRYRSQLEPHNFCSKKCCGAWLGSWRRGENSPTWRGGSVNYRGPNWPEQRHAARERDGHRCVRCGVVDTLQVHHKRPFRCFDSYFEANRLENLETLCLPCHRKDDGNLRAAKIAPPPSVRRTVICEECGADFWSQSGTARRCAICSPRRVRRVLA